MALFSNLFGMIGTHRNNLDPPLVKVGSKFFPSPQLGDTVRSPVSPEKFNKHDVALQGSGIEDLAVFIQRGEMRYDITDRDRFPTQLLRTNGNGEWEQRTDKHGNCGCRRSKPTRTDHKGGNTKRHCK